MEHPDNSLGGAEARRATQTSTVSHPSHAELLRAKQLRSCTVPRDIRVRWLVLRDLQRMGSLLRMREMPHTPRQRLRLMEWAAFHNPLAPPQRGQPGAYLLAEDGGRIVAFMGCMPICLLVQGQERPSRYPHDLFIHPAYRRRPLAKTIVRRFYELVEAQSSTIFPVLRPPFMRGEVAGRYAATPGITRYVKILQPGVARRAAPAERMAIIAAGPIAGAASFLLDGALRLADMGSGALWREPAHDVFEVERFDERFDQLNQRVAPSLGIAVSRTADMLNWRYIDRPFSAKQVLAVERAGELRGFIVLGVRQRDGRAGGVICDLFADPDDTAAIATLCRHAVRQLRRRRVSRIECMLSDARFGRVLRRFLFLEAPVRHPFSIGNMDQCPPEERGLAAAVDRWHFTEGDSDFFLYCC